MLVADLDFLSFFGSGAAEDDACFFVEERMSFSLEEVCFGFDRLGRL